MRVLICGHRSFAARGLPETLLRAGHDVTCFSRGPVAARDDGDVHVVTGPVDQMHENPHLAEPFDAVVNYIMLKDVAVKPNLAYIDSLLRFCRERPVKHLIHISSISSYKGSVRVVTEDSPLEMQFEKKGSYGSIKAATEAHVTANVPPGTTLSLLRPGFVLGSGLLSPIVGTAVRYPSNQLMVIGNAHSRIPVISRDQLNEAVQRIIESPPSDTREALLLAAPNSPTRLAFLEACCRRLGTGTGVKRFPVPLWFVLAIGAEATARMLRKAELAPFAKITSRLPTQRFDPSRTETRLKMTLDVDWESALIESLDGEHPNFDMPQLPHLPATIGAKAATFIGFGRIVKQKHLPALTRLGFAGDIRAYDLNASTDPSGQKVLPINGAKLAPVDLFVVASPGPAHADALPALREAQGPILVEKPLCYRRDELSRWSEFAASRKWPVTVCHNYRFKANVVRMLATLRQYNPGRLRHVHIHFESPPVGNDSAAWLRNERKARTLLMDYSIHFLDLACMFNTNGWRPEGVRYELNSAGETNLIEGRLVADNYSVSFLLRQGFGPRRARLLYNFQNYSTSLGFFPDTFVGHLSNDNPWLHKQESREAWRATTTKVLDKLLGRDSDTSHAIALAAATGQAGPDAVGATITVERLAAFYRLMFDLVGIVYEDA